MIACPVCDRESAPISGDPRPARWIGPDGELYCSMHFINASGTASALVKIEDYEPPARDEGTREATPTRRRRPEVKTDAEKDPRQQRRTGRSRGRSRRSSRSRRPQELSRTAQALAEKSRPSEVASRPTTTRSSSCAAGRLEPRRPRGDSRSDGGAKSRRGGRGVVPCAALARGMRQTAPHTGLPVRTRSTTTPAGADHLDGERREPRRSTPSACFT